MMTVLAAWRSWLPVMALAAALAWHNAAVRNAEQRGRSAALADVRSATAAKGILADKAAHAVEACYAAGKLWNRETGTCG